MHKWQLLCYEHRWHTCVPRLEATSFGCQICDFVSNYVYIKCHEFAYPYKNGLQIASALPPEIAAWMIHLLKEKLMLLSKFCPFHEMCSFGKRMAVYIMMHKLHQFAQSYDRDCPHNCIFTQWNKGPTPENYAQLSMHFNIQGGPNPHLGLDLMLNHGETYWFQLEVCIIINFTLLFPIYFTLTYLLYVSIKKKEAAKFMSPSWLSMAKLNITA